MDIFFKKIKYALKAFREYPDFEIERKISAINFLVRNENLKTYYQPIMDLGTGNILGYEALNRPELGAAFNNASELFSFAEKQGLIYDLDLKCRELSVIRIANSLNNQLLFLNVNSNVLLEVSKENDPFAKIINKLRIDKSNLVLEITEREAIKDFNLFNKVLDQYREEGFKVAVDDLGAGYSSLQTIAELKPDFIKLDMSLVHDIHKIDYKLLLVETLVEFAKKSKSLLIAEGIEQSEEFEVLTQLGVPFGQGYYIEKPKYYIELAS
ncbi:hypothetical protein BHF71_01995 [Vulcanibacillus modesticaldus]|uniref:EAL domain-containing protein n=1 Tax=Vulcanibacillus modesticaldus TaxID=337097 RepID=A0A1D2YUN2_9BACI|nr:EAL domain-containing protein [Vulcanibacillus modesticaldus]OEF99381.1 hypothetical protein BHF71_01995 [Vulcanibacillus modesticaldus]